MQGQIYIFPCIFRSVGLNLPNSAWLFGCFLW